MLEEERGENYTWRNLLDPGLDVPGILFLAEIRLMRIEISERPIRFVRIDHDLQEETSDQLSPLFTTESL